MQFFYKRRLLALVVFLFTFHYSAFAETPYPAAFYAYGVASNTGTLLYPTLSKACDMERAIREASLPNGYNLSSPSVGETYLDSCNFTGCIERTKCQYLLYRPTDIVPTFGLVYSTYQLH